MESDSSPAPRSGTGKILAIASPSRWLVPLVALAVIALSVLELDIGLAGWNKSVAETAGRVAVLTGDRSVCIFLALVMLIYWGIRERREAAADLAIAVAWLTGAPGMTMVAGWVVTGARIVFSTLRRKVYEQIRSEGHAEGRQEANAEWQVWWRRRTATGEFVSDPNDPPPEPVD
jgi:hypothetical protein